MKKSRIHNKQKLTLIVQKGASKDVELVLEHSLYSPLLIELWKTIF